MADVIIPPAQQQTGQMLGGFWIVLQAWPIASLWTLALCGEGGARVSGGGANWEVHERTRRVGMTSFKGRANWEMTLDLLYDGWQTHAIRPQLPASWIGAPRLPTGVQFSRPGNPTAGGGVHIEGQLESLEKLFYRRPDTGVPPSVRVYGPVPRPKERWVITAIEYGENVLRDKHTGRRMRQDVQVTLLEYSQGEDLERLPRGKAG